MPEWLHGINNFAQIMKSNANAIMNALGQEEKESLYDLLPNNVKDKERCLNQILRGEKIGYMGQSPLDQFGMKL